MSANTVSDQVDEEDRGGVYSTAGLYNYIVLLQIVLGQRCQLKIITGWNRGSIISFQINRECWKHLIKNHIILRSGGIPDHNVA